MNDVVLGIGLYLIVSLVVSMALGRALRRAANEQLAGPQ